MHRYRRAGLAVVVFARLLGVVNAAWSTPTDHHHHPPSSTRRSFFSSVVASCVVTAAGDASVAAAAGDASVAAAAEGGTISPSSLVPVDVTPPNPDAKKLFNEGRALESQGNMAAALRLYSKVTQIAPRFIYGWSNLGNAQTALGDLTTAEQSYDKAIDLCNESIANSEQQPQMGQRRCSDLYVLLLNRGSLRLNNGAPAAALVDLQQSAQLRGRPDAIVLQNLARAQEINGLYSDADRNYATAISMTANEVVPFWLRASMVKLQLGDVQGGWDLYKRIENRFPEAPEVRAAGAVFLARRGDEDAGRQKLLAIPDRARLKYSDDQYVTNTIAWPPAMRETLRQITVAVGDRRS